MAMKYHVHHGKAGVYGEIAYREWLDGNKAIVSIEETLPFPYVKGKPVTYTITLYNDKGVGYTRRGFSETTADAICKAHLLERGYTEHDERDTWDIRAYND
jgi:hypothetical protein